MTYEQRTRLRAGILKMKGSDCPICGWPRRLSFYSEINEHCDRYLEICDFCDFQSYVDVDFPLQLNDFTMEIVDNKNDV